MDSGMDSLGSSEETSPRHSSAPSTTAEDVRSLRDFSTEIPYLKSIREDYLRWRAGGAKGMKGNVDSSDSLQQMIKELENAAEVDEVVLSEDELEDIFVIRKQQ